MVLFCQFQNSMKMRFLIFHEHFILSLKSSIVGPTTVSRWANHWVIGATTFLRLLLFWLLDPLCLLTGQSLGDQCYSHSQTTSKQKRLSNKRKPQKREHSSKTVACSRLLLVNPIDDGRKICSCLSKWKSALCSL